MGGVPDRELQAPPVTHIAGNHPHVERTRAPPSLGLMASSDVGPLRDARLDDWPQIEHGLEYVTIVVVWSGCDPCADRATRFNAAVLRPWQHCVLALL